MTHKLTAVVVGGGASGFFGAITCAQHFPECEVILLEKSNKLLSKVRISGGGRCNVTHALYNNNELLKYYPRGNKSLLTPFQQFSTADTVQWFESRGVKLKTEADGRIFPVTDNSETIIDCLWGEAKRLGVQIRTSSGVKTIQPLPSANGAATQFKLTLLNDEEVFCHRVLIATGGNPGSQAYEWLQLAHHTIEKPVPSLFTFNTPGSGLLELTGIAVPEVSVKVAGTKLQQTGPLLITHWGFSGPAILKLSAWGARELHQANYVFTLLVNWVPQFTESTLRDALTVHKSSNNKKTIAAHALFNLPLRLWKKLVETAGIPDSLRWIDLPKKNLNKLIDTLVHGSYPVNGKSTFKEEFVTCGGVSLPGIDLQTMESKYVKGLFFAGEVIDVDGVTGGFNFQSAWTTGYIAGKHMGN